MKVPLFVSLRGYRSGWLRGDVLRHSRPDAGASEGRIFATVEEAVEAASQATTQKEDRP